jgi:hypothetical protein
MKWPHVAVINPVTNLSPCEEGVGGAQPSGLDKPQLGISLQGADRLKQEVPAGKAGQQGQAQASEHVGSGGIFQNQCWKPC